MAFNDRNKSSASGSRIRMVTNDAPETKPVKEAKVPESKPVEEAKPETQGKVKKKGKGLQVSELKAAKTSSGGGISLYGVLTLILVAIYLFSFFGFMSYDSSFNIAYFFGRFSQNVSDFFAFATGGVNNNYINWRFYKSLIIVISGMALAAAGAVYKAIYRNTLASPDTMGVQSGGNLGNVLFAVVFTDTLTTGGEVVDLSFTSTFLERNTQAIMIFVACFISVILLSLVSSTAGRGKMSSSAIVLTGVMFSAIIAAFVTLAQYRIITTDPDDPALEVLKQMALGTFDYATTLEQLITMLITVIICLVVIFIFVGRMNLYSLGEEEAITMGMNVKAFKYIMIVPSTMLVAIVMAFCGHIAFVAFLVPQIARKLAGSDFKRVLICSILIGGILMTLVYDAAVIFDMTDALNVLTTSIGGIAMIFILAGRRDSRDAIIAE